MDRVFKINFTNSKEEVQLYNWLITQENMEDFAKKILIREMNKDLNSTEEVEYKYEKCTLTKEELDEISRKAKELFK